MNTVWEPIYISDVDCDSNNTEVVLLISLGSSPQLERSLLPFIRQNNYKIILFKRIFNQYFGIIDTAMSLVINQQLQTNQNVKIVFFSHLGDIENCKNLMDMLTVLGSIQMPFSPNNLGLILFENGEPKKWDIRHKKLDFDQLHELADLIVQRGMAWDNCVDWSYKYLRCEKYGCPALKILTNKDTADQYTNILLVKMTKDGQLLDGKEKLEAFINDRLEFKSVSKHDIQIFQPKTFKTILNYYEKEEALNIQKFKDVFQQITLMIIRMDSKKMYSFLNGQKPLFKRFENNIYALIQKKISTKEYYQKLVITEDLYTKMLFLILPLMKGSDSYSKMILNAILELLDKMYYECEKSIKLITSDHSELQNKPTALKLTRDRVGVESIKSLDFTWNFATNQWDVQYKPIPFKLPRDDVWDKYFMHLQQVWNFDKNKKHVYKLRMDTERKVSHIIRQLVIRADCEKIFQHFTAEFKNNWFMSTEKIETAVDKFTQKITQWTDNLDIYENEIVTWNNFTKMIGSNAILSAKINATETRFLFETCQKTSDSMDAELVKYFQSMIIQLIFTFNRNVTTVAMQRLAVSKLERVDAVVAVLDRSFMAGISNLHQSLDREQWATIRPHIFYNLVRFQQKTQTFDHFVVFVRNIFNIHHIDIPMASYERLQEVKVEFDVYQKQLGRYINGSIDTTQQWGRVFYETIDYVHQNSGTQQKSFINGAVKWIKDELMFEQKPTWPGFALDGTLLLVSLIIRKFFKGSRNLR